MENDVNDEKPRKKPTRDEVVERLRNENLLFHDEKVSDISPSISKVRQLSQQAPRSARIG